MSKKSRVAIIGAGVSGLAAAVKLSRQDALDLTIFEARQEPGGRTRSYVDEETGDTIDNGQHILASCYTSTLEYLRLIGSESLVTQKRSLAIEYWDNGTKFQLNLPAIPSPADLAIGLLSTNLLSTSEKIAAMRFGTAMRKRRLPSLSLLTAKELLEHFRQPARVTERLWEPIVLATINARIEQASAVLFVNVLTELFFGSTKGSALLIPSVGLSALLVEPAIAKLGRAICRFGEPVRGIDTTEDAALVRTDSGSEAFEFVIRTDTTAEATYSPIVNAYFWLDRDVLRAPISGFFGTGLQWAFPKPSAHSKQLLALTVSAADDIVNDSAEAIRDLLWHDLQTSVPNARDAQLQHFRIIKEKRAAPLLTPEVQNQRPPTSDSSSRVFLAGDYVQNGLPATIEGAVRNGFAAADMVLSELAMH